MVDNNNKVASEAVSLNVNRLINHQTLSALGVRLVSCHDCRHTHTHSL